MKTFFEKCIDTLAYILGLDCNARRESVDLGLCDFSGQGRNEYGK